MAKKQAEAPADPVDAEHLDLEYVGPEGQESPFFGPLVVGQRYQAPVAFGEYLIATHPSHWKRPAADGHAG